MTVIVFFFSSFCLYESNIYICKVFAVFKNTHSKTLQNDQVTERKHNGKSGIINFFSAREIFNNYMSITFYTFKKMKN